jgi:hypothetical protein
VGLPVHCEVSATPPARCTVFHKAASPESSLMRKISECEVSSIVLTSTFFIAISLL